MPAVSMDEKIDSHGGCMKTKRVSPQRKHLHSRTAIATKSEALLCEPLEDAPDMAMAIPTSASPRFTPSPVDPFARFDSTSSTSPSPVIHENFASPYNAREMQTSHLATESDFSSITDCLVSSGSHELPIDDACCKTVSLEQHLRHSDEDREVAMQSFILERFLPAAKAVAADHDRSKYSVGKPSAMPKIPPSMPVNASPSVLHISENSAAIEYLPHHNHGNDNESVGAETLAKSCGFFWTGLRSAMSCKDNTAPVPLRGSVTKKSRAMQSSTHRKSFLKDDLQLKVKATSTEAVQKQRGKCMPDLRGFSVMSPSAKDATPRKSSSVDGGLNDHFVQKNAQWNLEPSPCSKRHPIGISHEVPPLVKGWLPCDAASNHQSMQTLRCIWPLDDVASSCLYADTKKACEESDTNAGHVPEGASKDLDQQPTVAEEDEFEFHDALSGFDMLSCAENSNSASQESTKSQDPLLSAQIFPSDMPKILEDHLPSSKGKEISACNSDHESYIEFVLEEHMEKEVKDRPMALSFALSCELTSQCNFQLNSSECAGNSSGANFYEKKTVHSSKSFSDLSLPGWPLGITSLKLGTLKTVPQETEDAHDTYTGNSQVAKTDVDKLLHEEKSPKHLILPFTNKAVVGRELGQMSNDKKTMSMEFSSPPVPPAPTTSSWLGRALAAKASKPPYLTILQQQQNVISVSKKQEITLPADEKKRVKWEDMVKESQEMRYHHPANQNEMKPFIL